VGVIVALSYFSCELTRERTIAIDGQSLSAIGAIGSLFASKLCFERILDLRYGAKYGVRAFGYNFAESEPIWMKSGAL